MRVRFEGKEKKEQNQRRKKRRWADWVVYTGVWRKAGNYGNSGKLYDAEKGGRKEKKNWVSMHCTALHAQATLRITQAKKKIHLRKFRLKIKKEAERKLKVKFEKCTRFKRIG